MEDELVLVAPRARRLPQTMYLAGLVKKGTENLPNPHFVVYSSNLALLQNLVESYNELIRLKKEKKVSK
jgi:hypothetical protein